MTKRVKRSSSWFGKWRICQKNSLILSFSNTLVTLLKEILPSQSTSMSKKRKPRASNFLRTHVKGSIKGILLRKAREILPWIRCLKMMRVGSLMMMDKTQISQPKKGRSLTLRIFSTCKKRGQHCTTRYSIGFQTRSLKILLGRESSISSESSGP